MRLNAGRSLADDVSVLRPGCPLGDEDPPDPFVLVDAKRIKGGEMLRFKQTYREMLRPRSIFGCPVPVQVRTNEQTYRETYRDGQYCLHFVSVVKSRRDGVDGGDLTF